MKFKTGDRVEIPPTGKEFPKFWADLGIKPHPSATVTKVNSRKGLVWITFDGVEGEWPILETALRKIKTEKSSSAI